MSLLSTAVVCCLLALVMALIAASEESAGRKPSWLYTMAVIMAVSGVVIGGIHFFVL